MPDDLEDLGSLHQANQADAERAARRERQLAALEAAPQPDGAAPSQEPDAKPDGGGDGVLPPGSGIAEGAETAVSALADIGTGIVELPRAAVSGAINAFGEVGKMAHDLADDVAPKLGPLGYRVVVGGPKGLISLQSPEESKDVPNPLEALKGVVGDPESTTGKIVQGIAKFATAFFATRNVPGMAALGELGTAGEFTAAAARGALADFSVFDPAEGNLSTLIEEVPALQNPVTEFLSADSGDTAVEGRLKNTLEGLGVGAIGETFLRGLRLLRSARKARPALEQGAQSVEEATARAKGQTKVLGELVGDPAKPAFEIRPVSEAQAGQALEAAVADGPEPAGRVFVNWSRINSDQDLKEVIQNLADARAPQIEGAQRGVRSWRATRRSAGQIDAWDTLMSRQKGEPLNAEQSVAVRELWVGSGEQVRALAERVVDDPSDLNKIAFRKALAVHNAIQERVIGARTETARALNAWAIPAGPGANGKGTAAFAGRMEQLKTLIESDRAVEDIAKGVQMLGDAGLAREADAFVLGAARQRAAGIVRQLFYASMLSSPHTQVRNVVGNSAAIPLQIAERKFANLLGRAKGVPEVATGEASAQLFGMLKGLRDSFVITAKGREALEVAAKKAAALDAAGARDVLAQNADEFGTGFRSLATGETGIGVGRLELPQQGALDPDTLGLGKETGLGRVLSFLDTTTRAPMRVLGAADEVFKTTTYNMELQAQALRRATREAAEGQISHDGIVDRVAQLVGDPDERMRLMAEEFAKTSTFTNRPLDTPTWRLAKAIQDVPVFGRLVLPFRSTPYNIATFSFQRTPLAPFVRQWRNDIRAGGAAGDLAWSKMLVGSGIMLSMADLAMKDHITGQGPEDPRQREQWSRSGWQPNSIRVGDRYFSYQSLDPISVPIGLAANAVDILRFKDWDDDDVQVDELVIASSLAIASQVTSQSYMRGVSDFFNMMSDPNRYGERWFQNVGSLVVPRGVALAARLDDPTVRMAEDIGDSIRRQTPGLSKDLPAMRDVWGRPIDRQSGLGGLYDFLVPQRSSEWNPEPIDDALNRLERYVTRPPKRVYFDGVGVNMDLYPRIYSRYVELAGNALTESKYGVPIGLTGRGAKDELNALVSGRHPMSEIYNLATDGPDGGKADMIENIVNQYRDAARDQILEEFPELRAIVSQRRDEKPTRFGIGGAP